MDTMRVNKHLRLATVMVGALLLFAYLLMQDNVSVIADPGDDKGNSHRRETGQVQIQLDQEAISQAPVAQPLGATQDWTYLLSEDFEGDFPGTAWTLSGDPTWGKTGYRVYTDDFSGYAIGGGSQAVNPPGPYPNEVNSWMVAGPFDLSEATDAELLFHHWTKTEMDYDWLWAMASIDGDEWWGNRWSGDWTEECNGWCGETFDLTDVGDLGNLCGQSRVWIAFALQSDSSLTEEGAYVDDIELRVKLGANSTATPTPTRTPTITPTTTPNPCPPGRTYTTDEDFDEGVLFNINHDNPNNNQLQLNEDMSPHPFIWIALSGRGTVAKVNTETGDVLGEYRSAPDGRSKNPSRTTVDRDGNVWVGNRDEAAGGKGSVVQIGLQEKHQCIDRNGNGVIDTSTGLGDIKPWPNTGGADNDGGVSTAEDECIIKYLRVNGTGVRTVAVDPATNDVWVGGYTNRVHDLINGDTGAVLKTIHPECGGYGGLVDSNGVLWTASGNISSAKILRYDPATNTATCINDLPYSYGLGIDSNGNIWTSRCSAQKITKLSPNGAIIGDYPSPNGTNCPTGLAVNMADNNVWIANRFSANMTRLDNNGNKIAIITVGSYPTGAAVDAAGKVWVTNFYSNNAMRIAPATNQVDLTVDLGHGANPYNYSDMTGSVILGTVPQGTWTVIHDSGTADAPWGTLSWHSNEPAGASIAVRVRSAENQVDLSNQPWVQVTNGVAFTNVPNGRYLQVEARLISPAQGVSPILYDLTVTPRCNAQPMLYIEPASVTTTISNTVTVDVRIRDVADLYSMQLYLSFDPALVEVVDATPGGDVNIEPGDFLAPGAVVYTNYVDNTTGKIEYVQSRQGEVSGVDGAGLLARITFHGKAAGTSPVQFTLHKLSNPQSEPIAHDSADGEIIVEGMGSVSGHVILERRVNKPNDNAGVTVELAGQSQVTGADGNYSFSNVPAGVNQIRITHPSYLLTWRDITVSAGGTTAAPEVTLLGGDCNTPQGRIDGIDATTMGIAWDSHPGDANWNARADVRNDNVIDVFDLTAVKYNWGKVAPGPWPGLAAFGDTTGIQAAAQSWITDPTAETSVIISPTTASTSVGSQVVVEVWVQDVENLYGGGFQLQFDPGKVMVQDANPDEDGVQIESGSWLKRQLSVANSVDNGYGQIDFFVTQRYPEPVKNGSGILARITFTGMDAGNATLHFNSVQLVDDTASEIPTSAQDGTVVVQAGHCFFLPIILADES